MTETEYMKILEPIDKAEESTRPFLVQREEESMVIGDPNDTEIKKEVFKITFKLPDEKKGSKIITKEYPNVFIKPRYNTRIVRTMSNILPFFRKVNDDGTVVELTDDDVANILDTEVPEYLYDEMYDLVTLVLGIDERLKDYMIPPSVVNASLLIFRIVSRID